MITITVRRRTGPPLPLGRRDMARAVQGVLDMAGLGSADLEVAVVGDAEMERLNREHAGCPGPTNVLSFPLDQDGPDVPHSPDNAGESHGPSLGLVVLSRDALEREALLYGQDPAEHCVRLLAHGTLHLCGLDHGPAMQAMTEQAVEAEFWMDER